MRARAPQHPGQLYWLASYPKSGNTWMRVLLTNYLRDDDQPADINELDGGPIASARPVFDDNVGVEASDLTQDEIERLRPAVYELVSDRIASQAHTAAEDLAQRFFKVHDAYTQTGDGVPVISKRATAGVIYLVRNPLDVAPSFANHMNRSVEHAVATMGDSNAAFVDGTKRLHNQLRQRLLTWSDHVVSWIDEPDQRLLIVRYEDLAADTEGVLAHVVQFAGEEPEPDRIRKAVEFSRFDRLKEQESNMGFREKVGKSEAFFRKGAVGAWRDDMSLELAERVCSDHGAVMRRLGYRTDVSV